MLFVQSIKKGSFAFLLHYVNSSLVKITEKPPDCQGRQAWTSAAAPQLSSSRTWRSLCWAGGMQQNKKNKTFRKTTQHLFFFFFPFLLFYFRKVICSFWSLLTGSSFRNHSKPSIASSFYELVRRVLKAPEKPGMAPRPTLLCQWPGSGHW